MARRDFLGRVVAHLAVAIHCYHPLAHWLARRVELRQEMAADALAARCVGGRHAYLRCLASLALKTEARAVGMLPTFLSRPSALLRRIAMLRVTEDARSQPFGWRSVGIVGVLSLLALGLRGGSSEVLGEAPESPKTLVATSPPLDVSLVQWETDKDTVGYYAIRVDELLKLPALQAQSKLLKALQLALGAQLPVRLEDIEQIAGRVSIMIDPEKPAPNRSVLMSVTMLRFNRDMDWGAGSEKAFGKAVPCEYKGETYYQVEAPKTLQPLFGGEKTLHFYPSDSRTLLFLGSADVVKRAIDGKNAAQPKPGWNDHWRQVEHGMLAIVLADARKRMEGKLAVGPAEKKVDAEDKLAYEALEKIFAKTDSLVLGVDVRDDLSLKARFKNRTAADAGAVAEQCELIRKLFKDVIDKEAPPRDAPGLTRVAHQIQDELLSSTAIRSHDDGVVVSCKSTDGMKALWKVLADMADEK